VSTEIVKQRFLE